MDSKKVIEGVKNYAVDTTGLLLASTPIYASMEVFFSGMSSSTSLESRIKVAELAFMGLGIAYTKGRDFVRDKFNIDDNSPEKYQTLLDSAYNVSFNVAVAMPIYLSSGADLKQAAMGALGGIGLGLVSGPINGWSIDTFRDFVGTKKSNRLPKILQNTNRYLKKALAAGLIGGTIATTGLVYDVKDKYFSDVPKSQVVSEIDYSPSFNS